MDTVFAVYARDDHLDKIRRRVPRECERERYGDRSSAVINPFLAAYAFILLDNWDQAREFAERCLAAAEDFFFGDWRTVEITDEGTHDVQWWHAHVPWHNQLRYVLFCGVILPDWQALRRIARYFDDTCPPCGFGPQEGARLFAITSHLRGDNASVSRSYLDRALKGTKKKSRLLATLHAAIVDTTVKEFARALRDWMRFHKEREFPLDDISAKISMDATFYYHFARQEGLDVELPAEYEPFIVVPPKCS
jgi:hypothetical protein